MCEEHQGSWHEAVVGRFGLGDAVCETVGSWIGFGAVGGGRLLSPFQIELQLAAAKARAVAAEQPIYPT